MKVGIIGYGWVGESMHQLFSDAILYDPMKTGWRNEEGCVIVDDKSLINSCDVVFICVPSPLKRNGELDTSIVRDAVKWCTAPLLVIRSFYSLLL